MELENYTLEMCRKKVSGVDQESARMKKGVRPAKGRNRRQARAEKMMMLRLMKIESVIM